MYKRNEQNELHFNRMVHMFIEYVSFFVRQPFPHIFGKIQSIVIVLTNPNETKLFKANGN